MAIFSDYARYYDLLYANKDYAAEVEFVLSHLKSIGINPKKILDLGCGTGRHDIEFAHRGINVSGVDLSQEMIDIGNFMLAKNKHIVPTPKYFQGDARNIKLGEEFDAVVSLFCVASYQNSENDLLAVLKTAYEHLPSGGVFLFDFWYGPGVLTDLPVYREKKIENADFSALRIAEPKHRIHENIVEVHYTIKVFDKIKSQENTYSECHTMRYWFFPELKYLAANCGYSVLAEGMWLEEDIEGKIPWNAWLLIRK